MTNKKSLCFKSQNVPTGVSDCHNIISTVIKGEVLHEPKKLRYYRSYKTFDIENFNDDIEQIKINQTCHEVDSVYNEYEKDFINVLNKHAPIKSRYQRKKNITMYESGAQKSCIQKTNAIFSIYKMSAQQNWEKFRKQRNFVTTFCDLKHNDFLFIIITSTNDGLQPFLKQVGPLTFVTIMSTKWIQFKVFNFQH
jgi:hypothetical protein